MPERVVKRWGDRALPQLVLVRAQEVSFAEVEMLEAGTDGRGEGGFGSSGS